MTDPGELAEEPDADRADVAFEGGNSGHPDAAPCAALKLGDRAETSTTG